MAETVNLLSSWLLRQLFSSSVLSLAKANGEEASEGAEKRKYGETIEGISSGKQQQKATDMIQDHLERKDVFCYTSTAALAPNAFISSCKQRN